MKYEKRQFFEILFNSREIEEKMERAWMSEWVDEHRATTSKKKVERSERDFCSKIYIQSQLAATAAAAEKSANDDDDEIN